MTFENQDTSAVTPQELRGWYSFQVGIEGYGALGLFVYFPILLESLAAHAAVDTHNHALPCDLTGKEYHCDVQIGSTFIPTTSLVFYATALSVLVQFLVFISLGALADHGG